MRRWTVLGSMMIACAVAPSWAHASATDVSQNDYTVEGEAMSWTPGSGQAVGDALAPDGTAFAASANGTGSATVTTTHSTIRIAVSARGDQCQGAPHMTVSLDGVQVISADVANAGWYQEYGVDLYAPAGQHTIAIAYTNQLQVAGGCVRRLGVDAAMLNGQPFSLSSYRNRPLDPSAPIDQGSAGLVNSLMKVVGASGTGAGSAQPTTGVLGRLIGNSSTSGSPSGGVWMQTSTYTQPVYTVGASQAKLRVQLLGCPGAPPQPLNFHPPPCDPNLQQKLAAVPLPSSAQVFRSGGFNPQDTDSEVIVWQPSTDSEWSFWNLQKDSFGAWTAGWGDYMGPANTILSACPPGTLWPYPPLSTALSRSTALVQPGNQCASNWDAAGSQGSSASAIPTLMGLIRLSEGYAVNRGEPAPIDHAIDFTLPAADVRAYKDATAAGQACPYPLVPAGQSSNFPWPAQRNDGTSKDCNSIPEGTRFRLPASLAIDALGLSPFAAAVARAVQRYGMVLTDANGTSSAAVFYGERAQSTGAPDPWRSNDGIFSRGGAFNPAPAPSADCSSSPKGVFCGFPFSQLQVVAVPAVAGQF
jgi:Ca-dependent carbohydrate-binding module xylan-binding